MFEREELFNAEKIKQISNQIKSGAQYENPIMELKREFWDVSTDEGKNEFAKDLTVMANSQYGAGNIIVGIDGSSGDLHHVVLPNDVATLANIINRKVLEPFTIEFLEIEVEGKNIIVIHIPMSFNKPHMLRLYKGREMYIPIRKGTRTKPADKYDLDSMYLEREKNVVPPYRLEPFNGGNKLVISTSLSAKIISWDCLITVLNTGSRINLITGGSIKIYNQDELVTTLNLSRYFIPRSQSEWEDISKNNFIKIPPNDALRINLGFEVPTQEEYTKLNALMDSYSGQITLIDVTGKESYTGVINISNARLQR
ncbi:AlbA family DNA-binding domain-containing protein [Lysinibacillus sp. LZ02]|uniref:AlbA family DNA-binding domain-containing protein n=1 Tax=Lysinibacillus sp. LZ02 TaxID=3420668 RepID=UPI003D360A90